MNQLHLKVTKKSFIGLMIGNIILGLGIAIFKFSGLGNDPFTAMMLGLSDLTPLSYALFTAITNTIFFIIQFFTGRKYVGLGTLVNWFFLAYFVTFFDMILTKLIPTPSSFAMKLVCLLLAVPIVSFGVSLYQASDSGIAPFDSLSIIMADRLPVPYFFCRLITDVISAIVCFFAGGLLGIGTVVCAFCLGPFIHFFNQHCTYKLMGFEEAKKNAAE